MRKKQKRDWKAHNDQIVKRGELLLDSDFVENWEKELEKMNQGKIPPKVGLITVSLQREETELASKWDRLAYEKLKEAGLDVMHREELSLTVQSTLETAKEFRDGGVCCLIFLVGTWVYAPQIVTTVREIHSPFILWALPDPKTFSLTGAGVVHGSLDEMGIKHKLIYGSPENPEVINKIAEYSKAAMVVRHLSKSRFGMFGGRTGGMYTAMADMAQVKNLFGVEYDQVDQHRLIIEAQNVPDEKAQEMLDRVKSEFGRIEPPNDVMIKSAKLYLALKKIISEDDYNFVGIKCMPEVADNYVSCCLAVSLINDDGIVTSCECDVNAALTMQILKLLTGGPVLFADVNHVDMKEKVLRLVNCGSMPTGLAKSRNDVDLGMQYEYLSKTGGATTTFCCKPGRVTLARLARIKGQYVMQIATGEAVERPKEEFKEARIKWPHAFIRLDGNPEEFLQNCRSNHHHMGYGDIKGELLAVCNILNIRPIVT